MRNTVRRQLVEATSDDDEPQVSFDSTDPEPVEDKSQTGQQPAKRKRAPSALGAFLRERWPETVLFVVLAWVAMQLYSFNRDVGRLETMVDEQKSRAERLDQRIDTLENRLRDDINRLQDRIDRESPQQSKAK